MPRLRSRRARARARPGPRLLAATALAAAAAFGACALPDSSDFVGGATAGDAADEGRSAEASTGEASSGEASTDAGCVAVPPDKAALSDALHIAVGNGFACAVRATGGVVCWGQSYRGQLGVTPDGGVGDPNINRSPTPVAIPGLSNITAIAAGDSHACALDASGHVWCWGWNSQGQLGNGSVSLSRSTSFQGGGEVIDWDPSPALVQSKSGGTLERAIAISCGLNHSCAIVQGGVVACWGDNVYGQLGEPGGFVADAGTLHAIETKAVPSSIARGGAVSVAAGNGCSCAVVNGGAATVVCAGSNASNQLGGDPADSGLAVTMPLPANANKPTAVMASFYASSRVLVLDAMGNVFGAGNNSDGALGAFVSPEPAAVPGLSNANVASVATGPTHTCAVLTDGTVQCIGNNADGELGRGYFGGRADNPANVEAPAASGAPEGDGGDGSRLGSVLEIGVGYAQSCALVRNACRSDGTVYCWGFNIVGELGDGTFTHHARPVRVLAP